MRDIGRPSLVIPSGEGTWWAWLGWKTGPPSDAELVRIADLELPNVLIGLGEPAPGRAGFRDSYDQAVRAHRVGAALLRRTTGIIRHRDIELAALLCSHPDHARRFAQDRLGPLAADDPTALRLRDTAQQYLANGRNHTRTAAALGIHQKTVKYRIDQIEKLLDRSLAYQTFELEASFLIYNILK